MPGPRSGSTASGWTRIDPTAVVAPERLQRGVFDLLPDSLPATTRCLHRNAWLNRIAHVVGRREPVVAGTTWSNSTCARNSTCCEKLGIDSPQWQHLGWAFAIGLVALDRPGWR